MRRRRLLAALAAAGLAGCSGNGGDGSTVTDTEGLALSSPTFEPDGPIPTAHTCDGADRSPELRIESEIEAGAFALVVDDPDAGAKPFVHWLLWNVPGDAGRIPPALPGDERLDPLGGARQGTTGFDSVGYGGPCPPEGDGPHRYRFTLAALEGRLDLAAGARRSALEDAMEGHTLGRARLVGTYER